MFWQRLCELCEKNNTNPSKVATDLGLSNATATKWKKGSIPNGITLGEIATFFNVTTDFLLGRTDSPEIKNESSIKSALFNDTENVTDEMLDEVKQFAEMVKLREEQKRKNKIMQSENNDEEIEVFFAARSKDNKVMPTTKKMKKSEWERLKNLPETDDDF